MGSSQLLTMLKHVKNNCRISALLVCSVVLHGAHDCICICIACMHVAMHAQAAYHKCVIRGLSNCDLLTTTLVVQTLMFDDMCGSCLSVV